MAAHIMIATQRVHKQGSADVVLVLLMVVGTLWKEMSCSG